MKHSIVILTSGGVVDFEIQEGKGNMRSYLVTLGKKWKDAEEESACRAGRMSALRRKIMPVRSISPIVSIISLIKNRILLHPSHESF